MVTKVQGRRKRGRRKRRSLDKVKDDIKEKGLSADDVYDRATWRRMSSYIDPTKSWNKMKEKKEEEQTTRCEQPQLTPIVQRSCAEGFYVVPL